MQNRNHAIDRRFEVPTFSTRGERDSLQSPKYQIISQGALKFIADSRGNILSEGFHDFKPFRATTPQGEYHLLIGSLGSKSVVLNLSSDGNSIISVSEEFHSIAFSSELKAFTIKNGALTWIIDPLTGCPAHKTGYHSIERHNNEFFGRIGATKEKIEFHQTPPNTINPSI